MKESEKDSSRRKTSETDKWAEMDEREGNKWAIVRRVRATAERRTKGTRVKVVTEDREEASSKVVLRLRKPAIWDVISVLLYPVVYLSSRQTR